MTNPQPDDDPVMSPSWSRAREDSGLSPAIKQRHGVIVRWYLSFRKRGRVRATKASAPGFIAFARREKEA